MKTLDSDLQTALNRTTDRATLLHIEDVRSQIARALDPSVQEAAPAARTTTALDDGLYDPSVVTIDVRPDQFPNRLDSRDSGLVPVAIFTTRGFDARHVNVATLKLGGAGRSRGDEGEVRDVNGDGRADLVVSFPARDVRPTRPGDIIVELEGRTWSGLPFSGTDLADFVN